MARLVLKIYPSVLDLGLECPRIPVILLGGHWRLHKKRSPVQLLLWTTVLVSSDGLIKRVWSILNLTHRAEVEEKVLFMQKESLFRAFWTSWCFSLHCQTFNGRRKVSHWQCCQLCDFIMSQCLLFCLKPQLLETMDYVRISQLWFEKQRKFLALLVWEKWLKHDPDYILRNPKPYLELITFLCASFEANCVIFLLEGGIWLMIFECLGSGAITLGILLIFPTPSNDFWYKKF